MQDLVGEAAVRAAFQLQAGYCDRLGSPFTARLCAMLAERLDRSTAIGRRLLDWPGNPDAQHDSVALRLAGGLHALVRAGRAGSLADAYPPAEPIEATALWELVLPVLEREAQFLDRWIDSAPQTNEIRRSSLLIAGLAVIAAETGLPVALRELGASAGLNLLLDRYHHELGGRSFGDAASPVRLVPTWTGAAPPDAIVRVQSRRGVDLNPLQVTDPEDRERLMAYIWADQSDRLARVAAALEIAAQEPPQLDRGDAADWIAAALEAAGASGVARVVTHTIAFQYFAPDSPARVRAAIEQAGVRATPSTPLGWLRFEIARSDRPAELRLTLWPDGSERLLALADPHGARIAWQL